MIKKKQKKNKKKYIYIYTATSAFVFYLPLPHLSSLGPLSQMDFLLYYPSYTPVMSLLTNIKPT